MENRQAIPFFKESIGKQLGILNFPIGLQNPSLVKAPVYRRRNYFLILLVHVLYLLIAITTGRSFQGVKENRPRNVTMRNPQKLFYRSGSIIFLYVLIYFHRFCSVKKR